MAAMITRTVKTFKATAMQFSKDEHGNWVAQEGASVTYTAPSENDTAARAAFKAAGNPQKRGTQFDHELVEEVTYGVPVEKFMEIAEVIEK